MMTLSRSFPFRACLLVVFCGCITIFSAGIFAQEKQEMSGCGAIFSVNAVLENRQILRLELANHSDSELFFFNGELARTGLILILARDSAFGGVLEERGMIDDPLPGKFKVEPGGMHVSTISLEEIFPSLTDEIRKDNLVLFWSATVAEVGCSEEKRFGGYSVISRLGSRGQTP